MQLECGGDGMAGLVSQQFHAPALVAALHLEHLPGFQLGQAGMGKIKRDGDAGYAVRGKPFLGQPAVRPEMQSPGFQFIIKLVDARLQGRVFQPQFEAGKLHAQQVLIAVIRPDRLFFSSVWHLK